MSGSRLLAVAGAAVVCAGGTLAPLPVVLTVILALPLVLVLPGYALLEALGGRAIERVQRLVLVPALSIAIVIVVTLVLNLFPSGLTARSWAIALAVMVAALAVTAFVRVAGPTERRPAERFRIRRLDVVALVLAAAVVAGATILVKTPLAAKKALGYTALSIERRSGSSIQVEMLSGEQTTTSYRLDVRAGGRLVYRKPGIRLSPGMRLSQVIKIRTRAAISAALYLDGRHQAYRRVYLR